MSKRTLYLSLKKKPFDVMVTGEKDCEYRKPTRFIKSRLYNKDGTEKVYNHVQFTNGYGPDRPYFIAEYKGFAYMNGNLGTMKYSNGLEIEIVAGDYIIYLGKIIMKGNIK